MADEELPNEEKLQIAQHFLLSSPPGQFIEVLADVRKILPAGILPDSLAAGMARAHNSKTHKVVTAPSGKKVVVSAAGEVDPTHYLDSKSLQCFALDHLSLVNTAISAHLHLKFTSCYAYLYFFFFFRIQIGNSG